MVFRRDYQEMVLNQLRLKMLPGGTQEGGGASEPELAYTFRLKGFSPAMYSIGGAKKNLA